MYRIAICDDNKEMRRFIKNAVAKAGDIFQVTEYEDGRQLIQNYTGCDILFLDIDMPALNGIDAAFTLRRSDKKVKIIYVTGYADYMRKSFDVHPFAFLIKPVSEEKIIRQLKEAVCYDTKEDNEQKLRFRTDKGAEEFLISDIYYLEYQNRKIRMATRRGDYILKGHITELAQNMSAYGFACPHKSFSVNLYYVKAIKGYDIHMLNGDLIPLSQKRSTEFRNILGNFQADFI